MHDLVIRGGTLVDGTGAPGFTGDLAIDGDRIAHDIKAQLARHGTGGVLEPADVHALAGALDDIVDHAEEAADQLALYAVEAEVRPEIVAGLARVPLGPGLIEFFRLLAYSHDEPTRTAALAALSADPGENQPLRAAWLDQ